MVGGFQSNRRTGRGPASGSSRSTHPPLPALRTVAAFAVGAAVLAIAALLSLASTASAEPPERSGEQRMQSERKPRVSMSPEALPATTSHPTATLDPTRRTPDEEPPLTRAATRQRVDRMSPTRWLAHYGDVSIERRE